MTYSHRQAFASKGHWPWVGAGVVILLAVGGVIASGVLRHHSPIPTKVKTQLTSTLLLPSASAYQVDETSVKYDSQEKLLSYDIQAQGLGKLVVSEQPSPEQFHDIPQYYDKLLEHLGEYQSFDVDVGTVYLARPSKLSSQQIAVINTKGTLVFIKPDHSLTSDQWRQFFNNFEVTK